ncbi:OR22B protein, partial [Acromyrmex heyeri]
MSSSVYSPISYYGGKFTMQSVVLRYYRINKIFMSQIGIWPYQSRTQRILIPSTIVLISISVLIAEIICMFDTWGNVNIAVECMISTIIIIGCFTKLFNLILNIKKTRYLFSLIEYHWQVFTNSTDIEIMQDYVTFGRKVLILYSIYIYTSLALFMIIPMSPQIMDIVMPLNDTRPRKLLIEVEYRVDREKYYYPILFHSYVAIVLIISIIVCVDTTYISYVEHGCSLFAAIGYRLEHVISKGHIDKTSYFAKSKERMYQDVKIEDTCFKEKAIFYEFVTCLRKHQLAIKYVCILESSFTLSTGIQLLCNIVGMSLIGVQVINNLDNIENIIRYTALCLATFFHLLCMTLPGQRLMDHSLDVFNSVCRSHWYTFSVKTKKVLRILLYRSIVPCTLTAGKLYVMSMANYSSYYAINKLFLSGIGVWPYQRRVLKVFLPCLLSTIHYSSFVTQVLLVYDTWGNMDIIVEAIIVVTCIFGASTKLFNIIVNNHKFRRFLQLMCEHWEFFNSEFERHIMRYYASISQKVTKYFGVYFIVFTIFYLLIPLIPRILDIVKPLNESRPLIYVYSVEYRVDKEKYYYPILLHCYATSLITIIILFTIDTTYIMCVLHVCSLFIAISHRLENITIKAETKSDNNKKYVGRHCHLLMEKHGSTGNDYHELIMCLKRHQLALEHVQILNSTFTQAMFILLSLNMLNMSVIGIQLIKNLEHINEIIRSIFFICAVFIHLVCMCIPGQLLIDRSTEVFDKAYGSAWYTFSIKTRRLLRILLYRSFSPCTLTAGKMFILSMTMCSSVITSNLHI